MPKTCFEATAGARMERRRLALNGPAMGTRWSLMCDAGPSVDAEALRFALAASVDEVDMQMSPWKPASDLLRLNAAAPETWVSVPRATFEVLTRALEISRLSAGAFEPSVGALVDAWGFGAARDTPDAAAIREAHAQTGQPAHRVLELEAATGRARKHAPVTLDLCGIAKGYAVDRMADVAHAHGVAHALAAIDGELRAVGAQADGRPWAVALENPCDDERAARGVIELQDLAVATSGDYRHFVRLAGARVAHTMDGRSGAPVRNGVASVTVLAADCMSADAWATALLVAGPDAGLALAQRVGLEALFLLRRGERLIELGVGRFAAISAAS